VVARAGPGYSAAEIAALGSEGMPEAGDGIFYRIYTTLAAILAGYRWLVVHHSVGIFYTAQRGCSLCPSAKIG
jgi:hypothetical protein